MPKRTAFPGTARAARRARTGAAAAPALALDADQAEALERLALLASLGLLTEEQTAAVLGISVKTLRNRSRLDRPAAIRLHGGRLYPREAVVEFLERHRERPVAALPALAG